MRLNGIKCEMCNNMVDSSFNIFGMVIVPDRWFALSQFNQEQLHFCSTQCLSQWVGGEQKVETIENIPFRLDGERANVLVGYMKDKGWDVEFKLRKDLDGRQWEQFQATRDDGRKIHIDSNFFRGMTMEQIFRYIEEYIDKYVRS